MSNIVKTYRLSFCDNEAKKLDAMFDEVNYIYNTVNAHLIKIFKSKICNLSPKEYKALSKDEKIELTKKINDLRGKTLLFVNKKGKDVVGFGKNSYTKYIAHLFPNTLISAKIRDDIEKSLTKSWDAFFKNIQFLKFKLPQFKSKRNGNLLTSFGWNVGEVAFRKGFADNTFIIKKDTNEFSLFCEKIQAKNKNKKRIVNGKFIFKTNKQKNNNYRDNDKKFNWFDEDLDICTFTITRKEIRGKNIYHLQITYKQPNIQKKEINNKTRIGIDINLNNYAIYSSQHGCLGLPSVANEKWYQKHRAKLITLQKKLDIATRDANPDSFNANGTRRKRNSVTSDLMKRLNTKIKIEHRRISETRKNYQGFIANGLINENPSVIKWEDSDFSSWAKRAKVGFGRRNKKKRYGAQVSKSAPYYLKTLLKNKCTANGINFIEVSDKIGCTRFDCTNGEKNADFAKLSNRTHTTSDGKEHSRDLISAYNISCCDEDTIDKELAYNGYNEFCKYEKIEIERLKARNIKNGLI